MNADPEVMRYFLAPATHGESQEMLNRLRKQIDERGWGVWAVEVDGAFAGMVGLNVPKWQLPFSPCTEILWRLRKEFWGRGIAFAAASHAMDYGFSKVGLREIVAFTTPPNIRSIRLMDRLGLGGTSVAISIIPPCPRGIRLGATFSTENLRRGRRGLRDCDEAVGNL